MNKANRYLALVADKYKTVTVKFQADTSARTYDYVAPKDSEVSVGDFVVVATTSKEALTVVEVVEVDEAPIGFDYSFEYKPVYSLVQPAQWEAFQQGKKDMEAKFQAAKQEAAKAALFEDVGGIDKWGF